MEQSASPTTATQAELIAARLGHLFTQYRQAHRRKATDQQVADHVRAETGKPCSRHWIRDLRNAANRAPDLSKLEAIASFFGVSRRYLFDDTEAAAVTPDIETRLAIKKLEVNGIHLRQLSGLTDDQLRLVRAVIRELAGETPNCHDQ